MPTITIDFPESVMASLERLANGAPLGDLCAALVEDGISLALNELPPSEIPSLLYEPHDFGVRRGHLVTASDEPSILKQVGTAQIAAHRGQGSL
ncbi:hypothetical protein QWZ14_01835 [Paeniroseomonas aquatica]|uniref:Transposase n=1 Tax=Paeniroseomonas aquatica TaxID=373043 RepID=A0ABT8A057_9PROT|nr:hypothetical protein [Paeniroseomonas aquatica]MDN3563117.1 hypothetical protein [Paeniroseomonas aquatica]